MTRKKKAARKRKPVAMPEPCYGWRGYVLAWCRGDDAGKRRVRLWTGTAGRSDLRHLIEWLPLAAAWVEGGRR